MSKNKEQVTISKDLALELLKQLKEAKPPRDNISTNNYIAGNKDSFSVANQDHDYLITQAEYEKFLKNLDSIKGKSYTIIKDSKINNYTVYDNSGDVVDLFNSHEFIGFYYKRLIEKLNEIAGENVPNPAGTNKHRFESTGYNAFKNEFYVGINAGKNSYKPVILTQKEAQLFLSVIENFKPRFISSTRTTSGSAPGFNLDFSKPNYGTTIRTSLYTKYHLLGGDNPGLSWIHPGPGISRNTYFKNDLKNPLIASPKEMIEVMSRNLNNIYVFDNKLCYDNTNIEIGKTADGKTYSADFGAYHYLKMVEALNTIIDGNSLVSGSASANTLSKQISYILTGTAPEQYRDDAEFRSLFQFVDAKNDAHFLVNGTKIKPDKLTSSDKRVIRAFLKRSNIRSDLKIVNGRITSPANMLYPVTDAERNYFFNSNLDKNIKSSIETYCRDLWKIIGEQ